MPMNSLKNLFEFELIIVIGLKLFIVIGFFQNLELCVLTKISNFRNPSQKPSLVLVFVSHRRFTFLIFYLFLSLPLSLFLTVKKEEVRLTQTWTRQLLPGPTHQVADCCYRVQSTGLRHTSFLAPSLHYVQSFLPRSLRDIQVSCFLAPDVQVSCFLAPSLCNVQVS